LRYGRRSLALDLVEEFRHPVVDGLVLTLINTGSVKDADFHKENNGAVLLNKDALKRFLTLYEERMEKQFLYRDNDSDTSYRKLFRISYDISDDRTRNKVANLLMDYGRRVQYSVFECRVDAKTLDEIIALLKPFAEGTDSIRVYPICDACLKNVVLLGRGELTEEPTFHLV
jgi:CRISPR-associated protein Cas2